MKDYSVTNELGVTNILCVSFCPPSLYILNAQVSLRLSNRWIDSILTYVLQKIIICDKLLILSWMDDEQ